MTTPYRPPSRDMTAEYKRPVLKECPYCGGDEVIIVSDAKHEKVGFCFACETVGPAKDPHGLKWNSIPRRSEVAELLRLVDEVTSRMEHEELERYATQMRQEWGI